MGKIFTVYTSHVSYPQEYWPDRNKSVGGDTPVYLRRVRAESRLEALDKCLPNLQKELRKIRCRYLSVFVGERHNPSAFAGRLHPFQLDKETGQVRK
ncbi:hypothetical protein C4588_02160 [Candidatus Parcubacteria bacterium]|nr:MAG: hypothetical protein C4588_02160 [Candidatus Parcubacteria bacterium]